MGTIEASDEGSFQDCSGVWCDENMRRRSIIDGQGLVDRIKSNQSINRSRYSHEWISHDLEYVAFVSSCLRFEVAGCRIGDYVFIFKSATTS
jgi:hypothetical protein